MKVKVQIYHIVVNKIKTGFKQGGEDIWIQGYMDLSM